MAARLIGAALVIRAFQGSKRASVYREHVVSEAGVARIADAARRIELTVLSSLGSPGTRELDRDASSRLAEEITSLRASGELVELDDELTRIAELLRWCAHSRKAAWVRLEGNDGRPAGGASGSETAEA